MKAKKGMGFKSAQKGIAEEYEKKGKSPKEAEKIAGAVLAKSTRNSSAKAKRANPNLKRVKMAKK